MTHAYLPRLRKDTQAVSTLPFSSQEEEDDPLRADGSARGDGPSPRSTVPGGPLPRETPGKAGSRLKEYKPRTPKKCFTRWELKRESGSNRKCVPAHRKPQFRFYEPIIPDSERNVNPNLISILDG